MAREKSSSGISAQATAVVTGAFLSGAMLSISVVTIPVFLEINNEPSHLLRQWARLYQYGIKLMPPGAIATAILYVYAIFSNLRASKSWIIYALAAFATLSIIPYTKFIMLPTNDLLFELNAQTGVTDFGYVQGLVNKWRWLHIVRSLFPLVGVTFGLMGTLHDVLA
ncbi:Noranthrone monooxygenase [Talaromyces pinophilus]|nr:Noranthrone monooxygenase [Talaromyces pinophilus]